MPFDPNEAKGKGKTAHRESYEHALVGEAYILWMNREAAFKAGRIYEVPSIWEIADLAVERVKQKWPELAKEKVNEAVRCESCEHRRGHNAGVEFVED